MNKLALLCAAAMLLTYVPAANADCGEAGCKSSKECKSAGGKKHHKKEKATSSESTTKEEKPADNAAAPAESK